MPKEIPQAYIDRWSIGSDTPVGRLRHLGLTARLSKTPPRWGRPSVPFGHNEPVWVMVTVDLIPEVVGGVGFRELVAVSGSPPAGSFASHSRDPLPCRHVNRLGSYGDSLPDPARASERSRESRSWPPG